MQAVENNIKELNSKIETADAKQKSSRDSQDRLALRELKQELLDKTQDEKKYTKVIADMRSIGLIESPEDRDLTQMMNEIEELKNDMITDEQIQLFVNNGILSPENKTLLTRKLYDSNQFLYDHVITKFSNAYLILRNKQKYSAFPRLGSQAPPEGESVRVTNAISKLNEIEKQSAGRVLTKKQVADATGAMLDLFWYPKLENSDLLINSPHLQKDFDKKYGKNTPSRTNDTDILMYVVAEHVYAILNCYPEINPDSQKELINSFCSDVIRGWGLTDREFELTNIMNQMYFLDDQHSVVSSESDTESGSYSEGSDEIEELDGTLVMSSAPLSIAERVAGAVHSVQDAAAHLLHGSADNRPVSSHDMAGSVHVADKIEHQDKKQKTSDEDDVYDSVGFGNK